jgi:RNA polymerase sigma-70 factor (ECF subfamily)
MLMAPLPPAEVTGLLALMILHDSRRDARVNESGDLILLEEQDRGKWHRDEINAALALVRQALISPTRDVYVASRDCGGTLPRAHTGRY